MTTNLTMDLEFDLMPLGTFWSTFSEEAPNQYEYQALLKRFHACD